MNEPTITCPKCQTEIRLTDSLAAPLIETTRKQYQQVLDDKETEIHRREAKLREQQAAVAKAQQSIDEQVAAKLDAERAAIAAGEAKKARDACADEISRAQQEKAATEEILKDREAKLAAAQRAELELRRDRQQLQEEKENFELDKQRAIDAERTKIRETALRDADEQSRLKIAEKDQTISALQVKLQDALRKAEQGSQQLQGEVQELELETLLRLKFPGDVIDPVAKGECGGDVRHQVFGPLRLLCGTILWECKRTKHWSHEWLAKLRNDQRAAKAEIAVIVSHALPKEVETFDLVDGVWVTSPRTVLPMALTLRQFLIELAQSRQAANGQQTKMEMVYEYLTGPRFRHRVQAIVERFSEMESDLKKERSYMQRIWAKRESQLHCMVESTVGMYGDLQGIVGKSLEEIDALELPALPASDSCAQNSV